MHHFRNEKQETTYERRNRISKSRENHNAQKKGNVQILGGIGKWDCQKMDIREKKVFKKCLRRTRKLFEIKLYCRNLIKRTNTWAVSFIRYAEAFFKGSREDLKWMGQWTRKLRTMHKALHRRDIDRLHLSMKNGERGLASIEESVDSSIQRLETRRKTDHSHLKQFWQHEDQQNVYNQ